MFLGTFEMQNFQYARRFTVNVTKVQNQDTVDVLVQDHSLTLNLINCHFHSLFCVHHRHALRMLLRLAKTLIFILLAFVLLLLS